MVVALNVAALPKFFTRLGVQGRRAVSPEVDENSPALDHGSRGGVAVHVVAVLWLLVLEYEHFM